MNIGIIGCGKIAGAMAYTINNVDDATLYAVASRNLDKATDFAARFGAKKAYGSYEALVCDSDIDLVYIATPHSRHFEDAMLCLQHNKPVLCEKAFCANAKQAKTVLNYAREHSIFVSEAIWTRFMPMRKTLDDILASGVIGEVSSLSANLGYAISDVPRVARLELAGGALLDLGVYTINFALMTFGNDVVDIASRCVKNANGADMLDSITLTFGDGKMAVLHASAMSNTNRLGIIYGSKGRIECQNINNCEGITVFLNDGTVTEYETPKQISGYEYELIESIKAIKDGKIETTFMPHSETIRVMEMMDSIRSNWGIVFPFE